MGKFFDSAIPIIGICFKEKLIKKKEAVRKIYWTVTPDSENLERL